jgi:Fic family protein
MQIGRLIQQSTGYKAFVPDKFPPKELINLDPETNAMLSKANLLLGRLDGVARLLPDLDFFILMYVRKEAALSSQIEGTKATITDLILAEGKISADIPEDVQDIKHYVKAINYGLNRLKEFPLSLRLIREVHEQLMSGARISQAVMPGEFRQSQNWIGGTTPANARFVPPPKGELMRCLDDFEKFMHADIQLPVLLKTALIHAQFETIHPFLDGNGRTGRLLIAFYLMQQKVLTRPVLYISEFFKRHRELYFDKLNGYHSEKGEVLPWIQFFLEAVATVSEEAIVTSNKIATLREEDIAKIVDFGRSSKTAMKLLEKLYKQPIINIATAQEFTGLARNNANFLVAKFVKAGMLKQTDESKDYGRRFVYHRYLDLFTK